MIREILGHQGYELKAKFLNRIEADDGYLDFYKCTCGNSFYYGVADSFNDAIETACRQYVKEVGFKLKWFGKPLSDTAKSLLELGLKNFWFELLKMVQLKEFEHKLIAWLYANDIKVVE